MLSTLVHQSEQIARSGVLPDRFRSPGDLVSRMRPRFSEFGITRLAEITQLDEVGLPVWAAVRPNAPTLSVSQGKGPTPEAAQVSAVMEAVEITVAERLRPQRVASAATLADEGARFDLLPGLLRRERGLFQSSESIGWVMGHDLTTDEVVWLPLQAVQIDASDPDRRYWQSTDGIGSGSLMVEAVLHGLFERIERDAMELAQVRSDGEIADSCLDLDTLGSAPLAALMQAVSEAKLHLRAFDITSDLAVPAVFATVSPRPDGREASWRHFDLASGSAARLDIATATMAAVAEALQSRLTVISGARDDFQPDTFTQAIAPDLLVYPRAVPSRCPPPAPVQEQPTALEEVLARLRAGAVGAVVAVPLYEDRDFAVAKLVVPGLELPPGLRAAPFGDRVRRTLGAMS